MTRPNTEPDGAPARTREERLAQRLRENLRLRKAQARALGAAPGEDGADAVPAQS
jgi:hypothetical protein